MRKFTYQSEPSGVKWPMDRKVYTAGNEFSKRKDNKADATGAGLSYPMAWDGSPSAPIKGSADFGFSERLDLSEDNLN